MVTDDFDAIQGHKLMLSQASPLLDKFAYRLRNNCLVSSVQKLAWVSRAFANHEVVAYSCVSARRSFQGSGGL